MTLYTDIDPYCCEVIRARIADGSLPPGEVWCRDVTTLTDDELRAFDQVHLFCGIGGSPLGLKMAGWPSDAPIVTGGFPCQDVSDAGLRAGITAPRSGLFREVVRALRVAPRAYGLLENVAALLRRGMGVVLGELAAIGRDAEWDCLSACDVGAPHRRARIWVVAHPARGNGDRREVHHAPTHQAEASKSTRWVSDGTGIGVVDGRGNRRTRWVPDAAVCRVVDGLPGGVDELKALGNAQVPQCVEVIARDMIDAIRESQAVPA